MGTATRQLRHEAPNSAGFSAMVPTTVNGLFCRRISSPSAVWAPRGNKVFTTS
jgi:hypothetical protein